MIMDSPLHTGVPATVRFTQSVARLTSSPASFSPRSSTSAQHASSADATRCSALLPSSRCCSAAAASHL